MLLVEVIVVVVSVECLLEDLLVEQLHMLLDLLTVLVAPFAIGVSGVKIVGIGRYERCSEALIQQIIPGEVAEPRMVLDVFRPIETETIQRFALDQPVDEVSSLDRPAGWDVRLPDLNLTRQDVLSDLAPVASGIRSAAKHALETNDAHSKVVDSHAVRLAAHHLRRHIAWSARCVLLVFRIPHASDAEVGDLEVPVLIEDQIFRFDITVQNTLLMQILQRDDHACDKEASLLFGELLALRQVVSKIATLHHINDKEEVFAVLESVVHVHQETK